MDFNKLSEQYLGDTARQYNAVRQGGRKWAREQRAIEGLLQTLPDGLTTLDVPVGTGRLFGFYKQHDFRGTGVDVSPDMLEEARANASELDIAVELKTGDIRHLPFPDSSFDLVMCVRFLNWVDSAGLRQSLTELARVSRRRLLVGIRHMTPLSDLRPTLPDLTRIVRRSLGHARARARKSGLIYHEKADVLAIFAGLNLSIEQSAVVEKRSDATDYCMYLLTKSQES